MVDTEKSKIDVKTIGLDSLVSDEDYTVLDTVAGVEIRHLKSVILNSDE
jgi:hypothetical protein